MRCILNLCVNFHNGSKKWADGFFFVFFFKCKFRLQININGAQLLIKPRDHHTFAPCVVVIAQMFVFIKLKALCEEDGNVYSSSASMYINPWINRLI